jgi:murein DD-endopeptidase MepM/ murein hydrolase activator NlpD
MNKGVSILIIPEDGGKPKSMKLSRGKLLFLKFLLFVLVALLLFLGYRYGSIYAKSRRVAMLEEKVQRLERERDKIRIITKELGALKEKNEKISKMLGIEKTPTGPPLAAIVPEKIEPEADNILTGPVTNAPIKGKSKELRAIPSIWPVGGFISQKFSLEHRAIDIVAPSGTPIFASMDGVVTFIGFDPYLGNLVEIQNDAGYKIVYGHTARILVRENSKVKQGEIVAFVGTSGKTTGPHLHYEIYLKGRVVDPEKYLN